MRGIVHRIEKRNVIVEIGKAEASCTEREQIPGERYNPGDRIRAYVLEVKKGPRARRSCSRARIPAFSSGSSRRRSRRSRRASSRCEARPRSRGSAPRSRWRRPSATWIRSAPAWACAARASRSSAASCAARRSTSSSGRTTRRRSSRARCRRPRSSSVTIERGRRRRGSRSALVIVPDNQLSLAIGKKGQNARLAAKLTGLRVDIKSECERSRTSAGARKRSWPRGEQFLSTFADVTPWIQAR